MSISPFPISLPREKQEGRKTRDQIISIIKSYWKNLNDYTAALNSGIRHLRSAVEILISTNNGDVPPNTVHKETQSLDVDIATMVNYFVLFSFQHL